MNHPHQSSQSLYQTIQDSDSSPLSVGISPKTLFSYVSSITQVVVEQQLKATVIIKPPQSTNWTPVIQQFQQQDSIDVVYLCGDFSERSSKSLANATISSAKTIPIILGKNSRLKRECFLLVLSNNFSSLVLGQWQKGKININASGKRVQQPYLETIVSFDCNLIEFFYQELTKTIADNNPDIAIKQLAFEPEKSIAQQLLSELSIKQLQKENDLANSESSLFPEIADHQATDSSLGLQVDFLENLVGEMRSSITYMKTTISLLESKQIKGEQRLRYLGMLEAQCDRQNAVISGLLELLQLGGSPQADTIMLGEFVPGIVSTYQPLANEKKIQLGYTIPANLPPIIFPAAWLRQIVVQLLNNSLQFTPPQGKVSVQATLKDDHVELTIGDTGRGINAQDLAKIFDGFYRAKTISNIPNAGAGLGLTIVRQLVEKGGGQISVRSKVDKGSTFRISLPIMPPELT